MQSLFQQQDQEKKVFIASRTFVEIESQKKIFMRRVSSSSRKGDVNDDDNVDDDFDAEKERRRFAARK